MQTVQQQFTRILILLFLGILIPRAAVGQIDPEKRRLFQIGYNQPLEGRGPIAGYAFYYLNEPNFLRTNITLRLAVAPIYLDSEIGFSHALGPNTDLGIGFAGGGYADTYSEIRGGHFFEEESFTGHGAEVSASVYHLFNPDQRIPLYAITRVAGHYTTYERNDTTAAAFTLPSDRAELRTRAGLRWGGREPLLSPDLAMEISAWYEGQFRGNHGSYGYAGDREIEANAHLFWGRALLIYTFPESRQSFNVSLTAGTSMSSDRFSAYRLGAALPMASEFPLSLPGYYYEEISAARFALLSGNYSVPLDGEKRWAVNVNASTAIVDYVSGLQQPGDWHSAVGGGISYKSPSKVWQIMLAYGYGLDAIRSHGRWAQSIGILIQYDAETRSKSQTNPDVNPERSRGLLRFLGL